MKLGRKIDTLSHDSTEAAFDAHLADLAADLKVAKKGRNIALGIGTGLLIAGGLVAAAALTPAIIGTALGVLGTGYATYFAGTALGMGVGAAASGLFTDLVVGVKEIAKVGQAKRALRRGMQHKGAVGAKSA